MSSFPLRYRLRRISACAAALALGAGLPTPACAQGFFQTGNSLLNLCQHPGYTEGVCIGFVAGISDALSHAMKSSVGSGHLGGWQACIPYDITQGQARDVAVTFLMAHPEMRHYLAAGLVAQALSEAFPCSTAMAR